MTTSVKSACQSSMKRYLGIEGRRTRSNLKSPSDTSRGDARRCGPRTVRQSSDDNTRACFAGEHESSFEDSEDCEAYDEMGTVRRRVMYLLHVEEQLWGSSSGRNEAGKGRLDDQ